MRIVFSKDRPAQLDLLLRSLDRYWPGYPTTVIYALSEYHPGYKQVISEHPDVMCCPEVHGGFFDGFLRACLREQGPYIAFLCDDDVVFRPVDLTPRQVLHELPQVLTFSLRLGSEGSPWKWAAYPPHDHGYPGSIDGHVFRTQDVRRMIGDDVIENPLILETVLARRVHALAEERPLMASYRQQCLVGLDVNTVTDQGGKRPSGKTHPQSAAELNERFLRGERISLDALDLEDVTECLVERQFVWEPA